MAHSPEPPIHRLGSRCSPLTPGCTPGETELLLAFETRRVIPKTTFFHPLFPRTETRRPGCGHGLVGAAWAALLATHRASRRATSARARAGGGTVSGRGGVQCWESCFYFYRIYRILFRGRDSPGEGSRRQRASSQCAGLLTIRPRVGPSPPGTVCCFVLGVDL